MVLLCKSLFDPLQSAGKLHKGKLPYLINSPGGKVILELVKGFTAFVGILQRISNSIIYTSLCIVRNCTADTPITNSSLFAQRAQRATRIVTKVTSRNTLRIMRFQSLLCLYYLRWHSIAILRARITNCSVLPPRSGWPAA